MTKRTPPVSKAGEPSSFRRYAVAATGAVAAASVGGAAQAAFIYTDVDDVTAEAGENIFFNMALGQAGIGTPAPASADAKGGTPTWITDVAADYSAWRIGNYFDGYDNVFINDFPENVATQTTKKKTTKKQASTQVVSGGDSGSIPLSTTIARFDSGRLIDSSSFFDVENHLDAAGGGQWQGGGTGFLGLRMFDPADGSSLFGWARLTYHDDNNRITLHDFALSGNPIVTGQVTGQAAVVPEPSTLALLALGAVGLGAVRSRKRR